jgi:Polyketide cyclase / dehydrase and lipid transport
MRIIKLAIISVIFFAGLLLLISLFIPSTVRISRAIDINAPTDSIRLLLTDIDQWKKWNLFLSGNGPVTSEVEQHAAHVDGLRVRIVAVTDSLIRTNWEQKNRHDFVAGYFLAPRGNVTVVQWYFDFHQRWYPWEKFASIIYDQQIGPRMQESLVKLKTLAEKTP